MSRRPLNMLFNWKLMSATALLLSVLEGGVFLIHRQQMAFLSTVYLDLAEQAKSRQNWPLARTRLKRYLVQNPDDARGRPSDAAKLRATIDVGALRATHLAPDDVKELEKLTASSF
jgi:hypothetical protein